MWQWDPKQNPYAGRDAAVDNAYAGGLAPGSADDFGTDGFTQEDYGVAPEQPGEKKKGTDWVSMLKSIFGGQQ
jgi:hypothetical protein